MDALAAGQSMGGFFAHGSSSRTTRALKSVPLSLFHHPRRWWKLSSGGDAATIIQPCLPSSALTPPPLPEEEAGEDVLVGSVILLDTQSDSSEYGWKTVRVRFLLEKECEFGQSFLLVGDDPMFGLWDPSDALPLEWSDGHVWTAELDIPAGKLIQFKFILRDSAGEITWQPGPDRILSLWDTTDTIVVAEDWDNADSQKITVEETSTYFPVGSNGTAAAREILMEEIIEESMKGEMLEQSMNDNEEKEEEENLADYEADLVLVPGLTPVAATGANSASVFHDQLVMEDATPAPSYEADDCNSLQLSEEQEELVAPKGNLLKESTIMAKKPHVDPEGTPSYSEEKLHSEGTNSESTGAVLRNDIQWGRKILNQILTGLGFKLNLLI